MFTTQDIFDKSDCVLSIADWYTTLALYIIYKGMYFMRGPQETDTP